MVLLKYHWVAILCSLAIGSIIASTLWFGAHRVPGFSGVYKEFADDQIYYLARAHDVLEGQTFVANPYLAEHKNGVPVQIWLPDYLLAKPLSWFSIPVAAGYLAYLGPFAALLFALIYAVAFLLTHSRFLLGHRFLIYFFLWAWKRFLDQLG